MNVPLPTKGAKEIFDLALEIAALAVPPLTVVKAGAEFLIRKRLEQGQEILVSEIELKGLEELSDEKWEYYIPAAYRFFEQVRMGEYKHNLRVLAKLIVGDLMSEEERPDIGKIGRAARKLELLPRQHLIALARCPRAFEIYSESDECDGYWICIDEPELKASFTEVEMDVEIRDCQEWLHELASRGILTAGGRPSRVGGTYYYRNSVFDEVIAAASDFAA